MLDGRGRNARRCRTQSADATRAAARLPAAAVAAAALLALILISLPLDLQAQAIVRGRVIDAGTGAPMVGAHVVLLDATGRRVTSVLANERGAFQLPRVRAGTFRLRAELIGRQSAQSQIFEVGDGAVREFELQLPVAPVDIPGLEVQATQQCVAREGTSQETQTVWEEARKALSIEAAVREQGLYRFDLLRYERDVDEQGRVTRENNRFFTRFTGEPFFSRPPEELAANGYHVRDGDLHNLLGPNSDVLLSDSFLDTHCFYLRRETDRPAKIGLVFEPLPGRRVTDIQGILWLDEQTAVLRTIDFSYTRMPVILPSGHYGGAAEFQRLENGAFIVRRWEIFSPITQLEEDSFREMRIAAERVVGQRSEGGEVINIIDRSGRTLEATARAVLSGLVWDSANGGPLVNAEVFLVGTALSALTDEAGRFRMGGLSPGLYSVSFRHASFQARGVVPVAASVQLVRGETTELQLAVPQSARSIITAAEAARRDSVAAGLRGLGLNQAAAALDRPPGGDARNALPVGDADRPARVDGRIVDHATGRAIANVQVRMTGTDRAATTNDAGRFRLLNVPPGHHEIVTQHMTYLPQTNPLTVLAGQNLDVTLRLATRPIELEPIAVVVRSERLLDVGFYDRRGDGASGHFITRDEIERRNTPFITDILDNLQGVRLQHTEPGRRTIRFNRGTGGCEPDLYIDDRLYRHSTPLMVSTSGGIEFRESGNKVDNFDAIPIAQLEGIEVYVGAATPVRYNNSCGVVLLWTRR